MEINDLISNYYEAFNRQDVDGMIACLHPDFIHDINEGKRQNGLDSFRDFMAHMNECYYEQLKDIYVMVHRSKERAAAEFVVHGVYLKTDGTLPVANKQRYILNAGTFFSLKEEKILRVTTYYNLNEWIKQVSSK